MDFILHIFLKNDLVYHLALEIVTRSLKPSNHQKTYMTAIQNLKHVIIKILENVINLFCQIIREFSWDEGDVKL